MPSDPPPAPWPARLEAVVWLHRAREAATAPHGGIALPLTATALVRYRRTPVGPYDELLISPVVLPGLPPAATIPFIAVDSRASVEGGRVNWALPKELARFTAAGGTITATGDGWALEAVVRVRPRGVPAVLPLRNRQPLPGGGLTRTPIRIAGRLHAASVDVRVLGGAPETLLREGRHAAVVLRDGRALVGAPR